MPRTRQHRSQPQPSADAYRGRIVVLTDHYTGSAAEVFASAIPETGRGIVLGQRSKAVVDDHAERAVRLEGRRVIPDAAVDLTTKDFPEDEDAVLDHVRPLFQPLNRE